MSKVVSSTAVFVIALLLFSGCAGSRHRRVADPGEAEGVETSASARPVGRRGLFDLLTRHDQMVVQRARARGREVLPDRSIMLGWPLARMEVTSPFGRRGREAHEGLDLRAKANTPVYAAQSGIVIYAGNRIRGYGKMVVVRHSGGWATVYAHASRLLVRRGQRVLRGTRVAMSGQSGRATGPHLHFELRSHLTAVDPSSYITHRNMIAGIGVGSPAPVAVSATRVASSAPVAAPRPVPVTAPIVAPATAPKESVARAPASTRSVTDRMARAIAHPIRVREASAREVEPELRPVRRARAGRVNLTRPTARVLDSEAGGAGDSDATAEELDQP